MVASQTLQQEGPARANDYAALGAIDAIPAHRDAQMRRKRATHRFLVRRRQGGDASWARSLLQLDSQLVGGGLVDRDPRGHSARRLRCAYFTSINLPGNPSAVGAQLLIDMPAKGAARLLTLSLLEQLSLHATAFRETRDATAVMRNDDGVRTAVNRLRGCVLLYREALGGSVSRKARRRLRAVAKAANALHTADVQLAWLADVKHAGVANGGNGAHEPTGARPTAHVSAQRVLAAEWLRDRLQRERATTLLALQESLDEHRPLRRLAKRLSVYTTAVRLDDMMMSASFGALTGHQLTNAMQSLWPTLASALDADDHRTVRRARRQVELVAYLLEPIRSAPDAAGATDAVHALRAALARLENLAAVAESIIDGGRRIGALHMTKCVRSIIWPRSSEIRDHATDEIGGGIVALAELLRDDVAEARADIVARWTQSELDLLAAEVSRITAALGDS